MRTLPDQPANESPAAATPAATESTALAVGVSLIAFSLGVGALLQIATWRCMQADGAPFFLNVVSHQGYETWDYPRQFAHYLTQGPLVLALRLGLRRLDLLAGFYGLGLYGSSVLCFAGCAWLVAKHKRAYLLALGLCLACLSVTTSSFVISESSVASALFFLLFTLLTLRLPYACVSPLQWLAAALGATLSLRAYEFFLFFGPLLSFLSGRALRRQGREVTLLGRITLRWIAVCGLWSAKIACEAMFFSPRSLRAAHVGDIFSRLLAAPGLITLIVATLLILALAGLGRLWAPRQNLAAWTLAAALLGAALGLMSEVGSMTGKLAYDARILHAALPLSFALLVFVTHRGPRLPSPRSWLMPVALLLCYNLTWQAAAGMQWGRYLQRLDDTLVERRGFVRLQDTQLQQDPFIWSWCMPQLSIVAAAVLRPQQPIDAIMLPRGGDAYQAFDPEDVDAYPTLSAFNVRLRLPRKSK